MKTPMIESKKHMEWIKHRACVATGLMNPESVDVHHVQFRSHGRNDYTAVPLRHDIHIGELHGKSTEFVEDRYSFDIKDALIATLIERIYELEEQPKKQKKS